MGVDIYGKKDKWIGVKPEIDWSKEHTRAAKDEFFKLLDEFEETNPGYYFRSNWWGWRPIHMLCEVAAEKHDLDIDFKHWGSNDGKGLDNQTQCDELADALEDILETDGGFEDDYDTLYMNLGSWTDQSGTFIPEEIRNKLDEELPLGKVTFTGIMLADTGTTVYYPSHACDKRHVMNFIKFLRDCGGFTIW
jgi:hypothetical protein|tara:strand:+ start:3645 stop:4220 length:576 start_codon:yes stop_codon:yes gene_type:complete